MAVVGRRLRRGRILKRTLLGEPVLLGRDDDGRPFALRDICPHRAMPLSYGRFDGREVECSYHGWRFDVRGVCTAIPALVSGQDVDVSKIGVRSYPCEEVQGNVWVFFGDPDEELPPIPRVPDLGDRAPNLSQTMRFPCDIDHAVVGLLDPAHGPFVHKSWWWRPGSSIHEKSKRFEPSYLGFRMVRHEPSKNSRLYRLLGGRPLTQIDFQLPGVRIEHVQAGRHVLGGLTAVTPVTERETDVHHMVYWTMPWLEPAKPLLRLVARTFLNQDRRVVELQQEGLAHDPNLMMIHDADTLARWYYQLKHEFSGSRREGRPFRNLVRERVLRWSS